MGGKYENDFRAASIEGSRDGDRGNWRAWLAGIGLRAHTA